MLNVLLWSLVCLSCSLPGKKPVMSPNRMPSHPFVTGDGFRAMAEQVFDETDDSLKPDEIKYGDIVFVKTDMLGRFFNEIYPLIKQAFILVSHNADHSAPAEFAAYLEDPKILRWFAQNPTIYYHEKFEAIPIGIENRYVASNRLSNCLSFVERRSAIKKDLLLGINFHSGSNLSARKFVFDLFSIQPYCRQIFAQAHIDYLEKMSRAKFILSPAGNGLDCHRTWEAIIVGAVPILLSSELDELLQGLPVVIVKDWQDVTQVFLEQSYIDMQKNWKQYDTAKITFDYWDRKIKIFQAHCRVGRNE